MAALLTTTACKDDTDPQLERGREVYGQMCALCHGDSGQGYRADNANALSNQDFLAIASDDFLWAGTARGRPGTPMSAWGQQRGGPLSDADVDALVRFMRSWQTVPSVDLSAVVVGQGSAPRGEAAWAAHCADCHGDQGQGGDYLSVANPEFLAQASDAYLRHVIAEGRRGTAMPSYAAELSDQAIDDLVALIRSWQTPIDDGEVELPSKDLGDPRVHPDGPEPGFDGSDFYLPASDVKAAYDAGARMVLLDARPPADYVAGHISGAVSVPFYDAASYLDQLPKEEWIVCYCACPHAESTAAAKVLQDSGYPKVRVIDEGLPGWEALGGAMTEGTSP